jgi:hypothetical protein
MRAFGPLRLGIFATFLLASCGDPDPPTTAAGSVDLQCDGRFYADVTGESAETDAQLVVEISGLDNVTITEQPPPIGYGRDGRRASGTVPVGGALIDPCRPGHFDWKVTSNRSGLSAQGPRIEIPAVGMVSSGVVLDSPPSVDSPGDMAPYHAYASLQCCDGTNGTFAAKLTTTGYGYPVSGAVAPESLTCSSGSSKRVDVTGTSGTSTPDLRVDIGSNCYVETPR